MFSVFIYTSAGLTCIAGKAYVTMDDHLRGRVHRRELCEQIITLDTLGIMPKAELLHIDALGQRGYRKITRALQRCHELEALKTYRRQRVSRG
jgi:hypothetical protein